MCQRARCAPALQLRVFHFGRDKSTTSTIMVVRANWCVSLVITHYITHYVKYSILYPSARVSHTNRFLFFFVKEKGSCQVYCSMRVIIYGSLCFLGQTFRTKPIYFTYVHCTHILYIYVGTSTPGKTYCVLYLFSYERWVSFVSFVYSTHTYVFRIFKI